MQEFACSISRKDLQDLADLAMQVYRNPHVRDKRHRPEDTQIQYLCVRRGEEHAFETGHGNTCSYWKGRP